MQEKISSKIIEEETPWKKALNGVIFAHKNFSTDHENEEKLEKFKAEWNNALEQATTMEEIEELNHHVPIDHIGDIHSEAHEKLLAKWGELDEKEESSAGTDLTKLKHAYDHAPFDSEHQKITLDALVSAITTEKDARRIHQEAGAGSSLAMALENKFHKLFERKKENQISNEGEEGLNDLTDDEIKTTEKQPALIQRIRQALGLK
jgi:hypothetical protein